MSANIEFFLSTGEMTSDVLRVATEARSRSLGAFSPSFNIHKLLLENLEKFLPEDAHVKCSGKLHVSMTRVHDGKNVVVSNKDSSVLFVIDKKIFLLVGLSVRFERRAHTSSVSLSVHSVLFGVDTTKI